MICANAWANECGGRFFLSGKAVWAMEKAKQERLFSLLRAYGSLVVALSGGVDSAVLLKAAVKTLGREKVAAVTAVSELLSGDELADAKRCAKLCGVTLTTLPAEDLSSPDVVRNDAKRCYYCKKRRFEMIVEWAREHGCRHVAEGTNVDDAADYRPGLAAIEELAPAVVSPLKEAGWGKADIRRVAKAWGMPVWDKPSAACLASRVAYGIEITGERLRAVETAEAAIRRCVRGQIRVRHHGDLARIEIEPASFDAFWQHREELETAVHAAGFAYVTLDLGGYRMGSQNESISHAFS